ncbi:phage holin [Bacillus anthracis]|nr:phage holin [Bacillus anthracis]PTR88700.1 phage holin [Bacillus anthracis]
MDKASVVRVIVLVATMVNAALTLMGVPPIPIGEAEATVISVILMGAVASWTAWKNNYLSKKGRAQREELKKKDLH